MSTLQRQDLGWGRQHIQPAVLSSASHSSTAKFVRRHTNALSLAQSYICQPACILLGNPSGASSPGRKAAL
eukprot:scaffold97256_cov17-Prasinocladus_malaysianus.AAC.1